MSGRLNVYPTADALAQGAANQIALLLSESIHSRGRALIALSGGGTPRGVYTLLASDSFQSRVRWKSVHVFWGDERCVSPEHPDSNFKMANETLLKHITIPSSHVHRVMGELEPEHAVRAYEEELRRTFRLGHDALPKFDLILLGLGDDGHTASLFPGTPSLRERQKLVTGVFVEKWKSYRVTLTYPTINNAAHILFLVSGRSKSAILADVLQSNTETYPAQLVRPVDGDLQWLVDQDAASQAEPVHHP